MNILILHRIPYHKVNYHLGIDHERHNVTYVGVAKSLATLPKYLQCRTLERPGIGNVADEVIAAVAAAIADGAQFDLVISLSEYELLDAAKVREALGITGPTVTDVLKVRDKLLMKQLVAERRLRVPRATRLETFLQEGCVAWSGKTVLKPIDGASSEDVIVFNNPGLIRAACEARKTGVAKLDCDAPAVSRFEVEEFVSGPILHFDGIVVNGRVAIVCGSRYVGDCLSYALGKPLGSVQMDIDHADEAWVQEVISAVGIRQGAFHLEAIDTSDGKVFLEIANRVGGADVVDTLEMATGIHLPSAELRILTGEHTSFEPRPNLGARYGWFVFPGHHLPSGTSRLSGHVPYIKHPLMVRCNVLDESAPLPRHITYQAIEVPMAGIVGGASTEELIEWMEDMFEDITIESAALELT